jgi:hypothetical protein
MGIGDLEYSAVTGGARRPAEAGASSELVVPSRAQGARGSLVSHASDGKTKWSGTWIWSTLKLGSGRCSRKNPGRVLPSASRKGCGGRGANRIFSGDFRARVVGKIGSVGH